MDLRNRFAPAAPGKLANMCSNRKASHHERLQRLVIKLDNDCALRACEERGAACVHTAQRGDVARGGGSALTGSGCPLRHLGSKSSRRGDSRERTPEQGGPLALPVPRRCLTAAHQSKSRWI